MTLIEKLLSYQTISGPYLGESVKAVAAAPVQTFQSLVIKPVQAAPQLQTVVQNLQLNITIKAAPGPSSQTAPTSPLFPAGQILPSTRLSQPTIAQLQQHPVTCPLDLSMEELFLLMALRRQAGRKRQADQITPGPFAQLSYLPIERPFSRLTVSRRKLQIKGVSYMNFRFAWEDEENDERSRRQRKRRHQEHEGHA